MAIIPRYQRQVYSQFHDRQVNTRIVSPAPRAVNKDLVGRILRNQKERIKIQNRQAIINTVGNLATTALNMAGGIIQKAATTEFNGALTTAKTSLNSVYDTLKNDPNYETYGERFKVSSEKILDKTLEGMKWGKSKQLFESEFQKEAQITGQKLTDLTRKKINARGVAVMDIQYEEALKTGNPGELKNIFEGRDIAFPMIPGGTKEGNTEHIPGAVENGFITKEAAAVKWRDGLYSMDLQMLDRRLHVKVDPGEPATQTIDNALKYIKARDENGKYQFESWLKDEDRDTQIDALKGERKDVVDQAKAKGSQVIAKLRSLYTSNELTISMLEKNSGAFEKLFGFRDEGFESDLNQLKKWLISDGKQSKANTKQADKDFFDLMKAAGDAEYADIQADKVKGFEPKKLHDRLLEAADKYGEYVSVAETRTLHNFIDKEMKQVIPEDVKQTFHDLTTGKDAIMGPKQESKFINRVEAQMHLEDGSPNPDAWTEDEIRKEAEKFKKAYTDEYISTVLKNKTRGKMLPREHKNYEKDLKEADDFEQFEIIIHDAVRAGDVEDIPNLEKITSKLEKEQGYFFKHYPTEEIGKTSSRDAVETYKGLPVFQADNESKWIAYIEEGMMTERWMPFEQYKSMMEGSTGTIDSPIPYTEGMKTEQGKYYIVNGQVYLNEGS